MLQNISSALEGLGGFYWNAPGLMYSAAVLSLSDSEESQVARALIDWTQALYRLFDTCCWQDILSCLPRFANRREMRSCVKEVRFPKSSKHCVVMLPSGMESKTSVTSSVSWTVLDEESMCLSYHFPSFPLTTSEWKSGEYLTWLNVLV